MDSQNGKTILTSSYRKAQSEEEKRSHQHFDIIELGCQIWYESLHEQTISRKRASEQITQLVVFNLNCNQLSKHQAEKLLGRYLIMCQKLPDKCSKKRIPSGWKSLVRELSDKLPLPKKTNLSGDLTLYESLSQRLAGYGMHFHPSTLRRWNENK